MTKFQAQKINRATRAMNRRNAKRLHRLNAGRRHSATLRLAKMPAIATAFIFADMIPNARGGQSQDEKTISLRMMNKFHKYLRNKGGK